jgi:hypothetical protein
VTTEDVRLVWDLLLLDTGDIVLHFETLPTNTAYLGESALVTTSGSISFTASSRVESLIFASGRNRDSLRSVKRHSNTA